MKPKLRSVVIVRGDLSKSQQAVQAGHALAELAFNAGKRKDPIFEKWVKEDRTLIILRARNEDDLEAQHDRVEAEGMIHYMFKEPDLDGEATALAIFPDTDEEMEKHFGMMRLA